MPMRFVLVSILSVASLSSLVAQQRQAPMPNRMPPAAGVPHASSAIAKEVLAFEQAIEAAVVRGDVAFLDAACAKDFTFTHGDGWTTGGAPLRVENKEQWLASVGKAPYVNRDLDSVQVEEHGDIVITYGRYIARNKAGGRGPFTVWFERVYARRDGRWQYVSHRTVHGPTYANS
jgi:ketosteroid isomerase-like protein